MRDLARYLVLPKAMTSFERNYLAKVNRIALAFVRSRSGNRLAPRARIAGIAREKRRDLGMIERIIDDQWLDPRQAADIDRNT